MTTRGDAPPELRALEEALERTRTAARHGQQAATERMATTQHMLEELFQAERRANEQYVALTRRAMLDIRSQVQEHMNKTRQTVVGALQDATRSVVAARTHVDTSWAQNTVVREIEAKEEGSVREVLPATQVGLLVNQELDKLPYMNGGEAGKEKHINARKQGFYPLDMGDGAIRTAGNTAVAVVASTAVMMVVVGVLFWGLQGLYRRQRRRRRGIVYSAKLPTQRRKQVRKQRLQ